MGSEPGHPLREGDKTAAETRERMRCFPGLERMLKPTVTPPSLMLSDPHCLPTSSCLPFTSPGQVDGPGPEDGAPPRKREGLPWAQLHAGLLLSLGKTLLRAANCTQLQTHKCREVNSLAPKIQLGCDGRPHPCCQTEHRVLKQRARSDLALPPTTGGLKKSQVLLEVCLGFQGRVLPAKVEANAANRNALAVASKRVRWGKR